VTPCQELLESLLDYVGGELVIERRETFKVHIDGCEKCGILVHSYTHTVRVAKALPKCSSLPPEVEARLRAVLEPELKGEKPAASPSRMESTRPVVTPASKPLLTVRLRVNAGTAGFAAFTGSAVRIDPLSAHS